MKLSIIIPAYNVADYIEKCIRSLENQDFSKDEYEIIVTNDGSPDSCKIIVEQLQEEFPNIILINQKNQGVSMARNNAIAIAKGKYILPIDPDDYVLPNTFGQIFSLIDEIECDCYVLHVSKIDGNGAVVWKTDYEKNNKIVYKSLNAFHDSKGEFNNLADPDRSWAIVYKKEIITKHTIYYPKNVPILEDAIFVAKYFFYVDSYMLINTPFYKRTIRKGSAINSNLVFSDIARKGFSNGLNDIYAFYIRHQDAKVAEDRFGFLRQTYIHFCILPLIVMASNNNYINTIKHLSNNKLVYKNLGIKGTRSPFNLYGWSFYINPYFFLLLHFFYVRLVILRKNIT